MDTSYSHEPWNKGKLVGQKSPLKLKDIWAIRIHLQLGKRIRDLALFNLAIDSKLRGCDLVDLRVSASECGTCASGLRINVPKHSMFYVFASNPLVRLRSSTNTQGLPSHRLAIFASQNSSNARPTLLLYHFGRYIMNSLTHQDYTAFIGIDWADTKHDICLQPANSEQREFGQFPHTVNGIEEWSSTMHQRFGGTIAVALELSK